MNKKDILETLRFVVIGLLCVFFIPACICAYDEYNAVDRVDGDKIEISDVYFFRSYCPGMYNGERVWFRTRDLRGWIGDFHMKSGKVKVYRDKDVVCSARFKF